MSFSPFFQDPPQLAHPYLDDPLLPTLLARLMGDDYGEAHDDLADFGERCRSDVLAMSDDANAVEPELVHFDSWGNRVDEIVLAQGWHDLEDVSAEEGLIALGYDRPVGARSRLWQFAKLYLFSPSSGMVSCPLAMTDGAARLLEKRQGDDPILEAAYEALTSRDPQTFWTSGQWMTERAGGSDVGQSRTLARQVDGDWYALSGCKWFTSATTSPMAMTLARVEEDGDTVDGSRGLSLFYLETRNTDGRLNGITIRRLKDKLGTKALPTAELELEGTRALRVGDVGRGVPGIATLINVTRLHNAISSVAGLRRGLMLARDYARRRKAFGKVLAEQPLHIETLARLEVECRGALHLTLRCVELLGKEDTGEATDAESATLRLLTPLAKLYTAKQAVAGASEILEAFGGAGYVEDTGLPRLLRDAQVLPIWEGTTNVLSLDTLRAIRREDALTPTLAEVHGRLAEVTAPELAGSVERVRAAMTSVASTMAGLAEAGPSAIEASARDFAFSLARIYTGSLMLEHAQWGTSRGDRAAMAAAVRWCAQDLAPVQVLGADHQADSAALVG
jgi:alkylation response protein AidB-like acyl-CoA dehydrogenase